MGSRHQGAAGPHRRDQTARYLFSQTLATDGQTVHKRISMLGVVVHPFNLSTQDTGEGGFL